MGFSSRIKREWKRVWNKILKSLGLYKEDEDTVNPPIPPVNPPTPPESSCTVLPNPPVSAGNIRWKPKSENDNRLVILIGSGYRKWVTDVSLYRASTMTLLERGRFAGDEANGCRPHYRFSQYGGNYGNGILVRATIKDGTHRDWNIADGSVDR